MLTGPEALELTRTNLISSGLTLNLQPQLLSIHWYLNTKCMLHCSLNSENPFPPRQFSNPHNIITLILFPASAHATLNSSDIKI